MIDWTRYPNFTEQEFRCKGKDCCGGEAPMDIAFLAKLQAIRTHLGSSMTVTSGFRCQKYDLSIGGKGNHTTGRAADIQVATEKYHDLIRLSVDSMTGIGIKGHGSHNSRFVHLDDLRGDLRPRIWSYR